MATAEGRPSLLVVDDIASNIDILLEVLEEDYIVRVATDGATALNSIKRSRPDLVLLDIMMPQMDGFEVCRRVKADLSRRNIPIIFLTALSDQVDEAHGLALGAADYITKPFNPAIVRARVKNHLELKRHRDQLATLVAERTHELHEAHNRLKALDAVQGEYLSAIAHELRTPTNGVLGIAKLAIERLDDGLRQRYETAFRRSQERLLLSVDSAILLARLQGNNATIVTTSVALSEVLTSAVGSQQECFLARKLRLDLPPSISEFAQCNAGLLHQSLVTLLTAAQMMATAGTTVSISVTPEPRGLVLGISLFCPPMAEPLRRGFFETFSFERSSSCVQDLGLRVPLAAYAFRAMGGGVELLHSASGVTISISLMRGKTEGG